MAVPVTATVITYNEAANISAALESLSWADEIVVVDSESTDDTVSIARRFTDKVIVRPWPGYVAQKNFAAEQAAHDWIFSLDADERVTPDLAGELASLIEKETSAPEERAIVSAVYQNRLRIRMPLQADPTVIYALIERGRWNGNLTRADLRLDSPYNTYRYPGLPPGPIAAPGLRSLEAAVRPADVPYLYFVSRNDGTHVFATTLAEHNRNVRRWQVEYFRRQR